MGRGHPASHSVAPTPPLSNASSPTTFACAFVGDDSLLVRCAELARVRGHDVRYVITASPAVVRWAHAAGIPTISAEGDCAASLAAALHGERLDWIFSVANLRALPVAMLDLAKNGGVNFHDGPLPRFGGVHAPAWALIAGEREHGITWHRMAERLDAGEIITQRAVPIDDDDTSLALNLKCFEAGVESFGDVLDKLTQSRLETRTHALDRASYHRKADRVPAAATLDWNRSAKELSAATGTPLVPPRLHSPTT
jgi:methionyl-tRNA formyltransferase